MDVAQRAGVITHARRTLPTHHWRLVCFQLAQHVHPAACCPACCAAAASCHVIHPHSPALGRQGQQAGRHVAGGEGGQALQGWRRRSWRAWA